MAFGKGRRSLSKAQAFGQRVGFTDEGNSYNNENQKLANDDMGPALLVWDVVKPTR